MLKFDFHVFKEQFKIKIDKYAKYYYPIILFFTILLFWTSPPFEFDGPTFIYYVAMIVSSLILAIFITGIIFGCLALNKSLGIFIITIIAIFALMQLSTFFAIISVLLHYYLIDTHNISSLEVPDLYSGIMSFLGIIFGASIPFVLFYISFKKNQSEKLQSEKFKYRLLIQKRFFNEGTNTGVGIITESDKYIKLESTDANKDKAEITISNVSEHNIFLMLNNISCKKINGYTSRVLPSEEDSLIIMPHDSITIHNNLYVVNDENYIDTDMEVTLFIKNAIGINYKVIIKYNIYDDKQFKLDIYEHIS